MRVRLTRRRLAVVVAAALLVAALAGVVARRLARDAGADLSALELGSADPAVRDAVATARRRVLDDPGSARAWGELGMVLLAHELFAAAATALDRAAGLDRGDPRWPYLRARALLGGNPDPAAALRGLERATEIAAGEPAPRLLLAETLFEYGRVAEAEAAFRGVLALDGGNPRARLGLARVAHSRGDLAAARQHLERSAEAAPRVKAARALLAEVLFRLGDATGAERERRIAAALPEEPGWPDPFFDQVRGRRAGVLAEIERANHLFVQGNREEAIERLRATVTRNPGALLARLLLGRLLLESGKPAEAETALDEAVGAAPGSFEGWFELGRARERQGKLDGAEEAYRRTLAIRPDYAPAHHRLGQCSLARGDARSAVEAFQDAIRLRPDFAPAYRDLGQLLARLGRAEEAQPYLDHARRLAE